MFVCLFCSATQGAKLCFPQHRRRELASPSADGANPLLRGSLFCLAMEGFDAALICLLGVGTPWSEHPAGMSFQEWATTTLGQLPLEGIGAYFCGQQEEFVTSLAVRAGGNALVKPPGALDVQLPPHLKPAHGVVRLSLRNIICQLPAGQDFIFGRTVANEKIWLAVRLTAPLRIGVVDRKQIYRPRPEGIHKIFANAVDKLACLSCSQTALQWGLQRVRQGAAPEHNKKSKKRGRNAAYHAKST